MAHRRKKSIKGEVFELTDIFEELNKKNVAKNIEYLLRRKKIWSPRFNVVFPSGALEINKDNFYQYDFEIFSSPNKMKYIGTTYGYVSNGEIIDMQVELKEG